MAANRESLRRVERLCETAEDSRELREAALAEIRRSLHFDAHAWLLTDPVTGVGCDPLADVPFLEDLPTAIRLKYQTDTNRWTRLHAMGTPVALLAAGGDPVRSLMWRCLLSRHGIENTASVVFSDRFGIWGWLDLWRSYPFTSAEADHLSSLVLPLATALRARQAMTFTVPAVPERPLGPVVSRAG
jgi:hypothetical protein